MWCMTALIFPADLHKAVNCLPVLKCQILGFSMLFYCGYTFFPPSRLEKRKQNRIHGKSNGQRSKFPMYWSHLGLTRIHTHRKLFPEVRKVSVRFDVSQV